VKKFKELTLEERLPAFLGLQEGSEWTTQKVAMYPEFITRFHLLQAGVITIDNLAGTLTSYFIDTVWHKFDGKPGEPVQEEFTQYLKSRDSSELSDLHRIYTKTILAHKDGKKIMFKRLMDTYTALLHDVTKHSESAGVVSRHLMPLLQEQGFLDRKDLTKIVHGLSIEDHMKLFDFLPLFKKGITKNEAEQYIKQIQSKEVYRNKIHEELKEYGKKIRYSEDDILAEIAFRFYNQNHNLSFITQSRKMTINFGVLILPDHDTHFNSLSEGSLQLEKGLDKWYYESRVEKRKLALKIFNGRTKESWNSGRYKSHISKMSEEDNVSEIQNIITLYPHLKMKTHYDPGMVAHGSLVLSHNLEIQFDKKQKVETIEKDLQSLCTYMKKLEEKHDPFSL